MNATQGFPALVREIVERTQQECFERDGGPIHDVEEIHAAYQRFVEQVMRACGAHAGCVVFTDPYESQEFERIIWVGYGDKFQWWKRVRFGEGIVSVALKDGKIHRDHPIENRAYKALHPDTKGQVTIPISLGKRPEVAVCFEYAGPLGLSEEEAKEIQGQLRAFFLSSRYVIRSARVSRVFDDMVRLGKTRDHDQFLNICIDLIRYFVGAGEFAIIEREYARLVVTKSGGIEPGSIPKDLRIVVGKGEGYVCSVAKSRKSFYVRDVDDKERYPLYRSVVDATKSQHTMPLISSGVLLGVLNVGARFPCAFSANDRQLLEMVANAIANALHDARVADEIAESIEKAKGRLLTVRDALHRSSRERGRGGATDALAHKVTDAIIMMAQTKAPIVERQPRRLGVDELGRVLTDALEALIDETALVVELPVAEGSKVCVATSAIIQSVRSMIYWVSYGTEAPHPYWDAEVVVAKTTDIFGGESVQITCTARAARASKRRRRLRELLRPDTIVSRWQCDYMAAQFGGYLSERSETATAAGSEAPPGYVLSLTIPCSV